MSERASGWYWVRINGKWGCMCFNGMRWQVLDERMNDDFFDEIGPRIPAPDEPWKCVPVYITAETGHKAGMMGEFSETVRLMCEACDGDGEDEHDDIGVCSECGGAGEYGLMVPVGWTTIKAIHRRIVEISPKP